ncbi:MAG: substrate-binding domain-containing protein [Armatimonadetes bacterium]|nr:substrate-binding domain-containing protein [Candidatus Hippobium faecium]
MKYLKIKNEIEKLILGLNPGDRLPTEADITAKYNVSRITVRKALEILEKEGTVYRTQGAGTFAGGTVQKVCVVYSKSIDLYRDPFYGRLINLLEKELYNNKCIMQLMSIDENTDFSLINADRIIIISQVTEKIFDLDIDKIILFEGEYRDRNCPAILSDEFSAGEEVCRYLHKKGADKILFAGNNKYYSSRKRLEGIKHFAEENNISVSVQETPMNRDGGKIAGEYAKTAGIKYIVCANDWLALGVIQTCKDMGLECPEDVSVISFDNTYISSVSVPPITTVDLPIEEGVRLCVKEIKEHKKEGKPSEIYLKARLIEKSSVK